MKIYKSIALILFFVTFCACGRTKYLSINNTVDKSKFELKPYDFSNASLIYSIDSSGLDKVLKNNHDKLLIVFFTFWCPNSNSFIKTIVNESNQNNITTILISPDDWVYKYEYLAFQQKTNINNPILLLDVNEYSKGSIHRKMDKFVNSFCDDCKDVGGFPSYVLFDKNNSIIYKGLITKDNIKHFIDILK